MGWYRCLIFRAGLTKVELLLAIGIAGLVVGLLLSAVEQVRRTAYRAASQNHLRQIGLALHQYSSASGPLPEQRWTVQVGPFLDQPCLAGRSLGELERMDVPVYRSPVDLIQVDRDGLVLGNYPISSWMLGLRLTPGDIPDGMSNTILCGEDRAARVGPWALGPETTGVNVHSEPLHRSGNLVLFCDGGARPLLARPALVEILPLLMDPSDGQVLDVW